MENSSLDNLASNGVINFDANAYINGTPPRFVGNPEGDANLPLDKPLMATPGYGITPGQQLHGEPARDAFISRENGQAQSKFPWGKFLTGTFVASLAVMAGVKIKSLIKGTKNAAEKVKEGKNGFFTECKNKLTSLFKGDKSAPKEEIKEVAKTVEEKKGLLKKLPKTLKVVGIGAVGLLGLYGLYKTLTGHKHPAAPEQH